MSSPTLREQLEEAAQAHEKAAAAQLKQARRCRAAVAAVDGKPTAGDPAQAGDTAQPTTPAIDWMTPATWPWWMQPHWWAQRCTCFDIGVPGCKPACPVHPAPVTITWTGTTACTCALGPCPLHGGVLVGAPTPAPTTPVITGIVAPATQFLMARHTS